MEKISVWEDYSPKQLKELETLAGKYRDFLDNGKTERECVDIIVNMIEDAGYKELNHLIKAGTNLKPGDKVYGVWMNKSIVMYRIGEKPFSAGMNILGAHIDSPRLDIKQNPLYEEDGIAYLDTHYYGGVKKYQWVTIPLALHGVIVKKDGTTVEINIGESEDDPVFFISDLLPHLAQEQLNKKGDKVIEGDDLDIVIGNKPLKIDNKKTRKSAAETKDAAKSATKDSANDAAQDAGKDTVKKGILQILKETYDIEEDDFISAELEVVPAGKAREAGLDRSLILGYGQDDRICAFTSVQAMLEADRLSRTACLILTDKEEIGSVGATGMKSHFFENMTAEVMELTGEYTELSLRRCLAASCMLSADVSSAYDPFYKTNFDKKNAAFVSCGLVFTKFTGAKGKSHSNDANAEYLAHIRDIFAKENIRFQTAEMSKVDIGGSGTIAYILARYGMNVIDSGVAVLNMHAPWEATSKADVYEAKRGYEAFIKGASL